MSTRPDGVHLLTKGRVDILLISTLYPVHGMAIEDIRLSKHLVHSVSPNFLSERPLASSQRVKIERMQTLERFRLNCSFLPQRLKTIWYHLFLRLSKSGYKIP